MATTPEAKVKAKIKKILEENNVYYAMPIGTGYGRSGVPDFLCCVDGKFLAIEAKATDKDKPTALQMREMKRIEDVGGGAVVIHEGNVDGLVNVLFIMKGKMK
jgi:hypothetical protein